MVGITVRLFAHFIECEIPFDLDPGVGLAPIIVIHVGRRGSPTDEEYIALLIQDFDLVVVQKLVFEIVESRVQLIFVAQRQRKPTTNEICGIDTWYIYLRF